MQTCEQEMIHIHHHNYAAWSCHLKSPLRCVRCAMHSVSKLWCRYNYRRKCGNQQFSSHTTMLIWKLVTQWRKNCRRGIVDVESVRCLSVQRVFCVPISLCQIPVTSWTAHVIMSSFWPSLTGPWTCMTITYTDPEYDVLTRLKLLLEWISSPNSTWKFKFKIYIPGSHFEWVIQIRVSLVESVAQPGSLKVWIQVYSFQKLAPIFESQWLIWWWVIISLACRNRIWISWSTMSESQIREAAVYSAPISEAYRVEGWSQWTAESRSAHILDHRCHLGKSSSFWTFLDGWVDFRYSFQIWCPDVMRNWWFKFERSTMWWLRVGNFGVFQIEYNKMQNWDVWNVPARVMVAFTVTA